MHSKFNPGSAVNWINNLKSSEPELVTIKQNNYLSCTIASNADTVKINNDRIRYNERARNYEFRAILALSCQGDTKRHKLGSFILFSAPDSVTQPCNLITCG